MNESESFGPLVVLIIIFAVGTWFGYAMGKENAMEQLKKPCNQYTIQEIEKGEIPKRCDK